MNINKYIISQCKLILTKHFVDVSKFTFTIDMEDNKYYVYAKRNGKTFFEVSDIYIDSNHEIMQYCVNWH